MSASIKITSPIYCVEAVAIRCGIREIATLRKLFGRARWRRLKGAAFVQLPDGTARLCELHWYEAHRIGKRKMKIKRFIDEHGTQH